MGSSTQGQNISAVTKYRRIGQGHCGSVWAAEGEEGTVVMKREDCGEGRSVLNDFNMHRLVLRAADSYDNFNVCVPRSPEYLQSHDNWWALHLSRFPEGYSPCNTLRSERIPPLPQDVRNRLIDLYCPTEGVSTIKSSDVNRDCLVRPYLGRRKRHLDQRKTQRGLGRMFFSLRNYPMHLDQAEDLALPVVSYAHAMAETLAVLHWVARIDANDIEFVLGGCQPQTRAAEFKHDILGRHALWILDFDLCRQLSMDNAGVKQAADAFIKNDPYFPRPATESPECALWVEFSTRYLECSQAIVAGNGVDSTLPNKFIARVVDKEKERKTRFEGDSGMADCGVLHPQMVLVVSLGSSRKLDYFTAWSNLFAVLGASDRGWE